MVKRTIWFVAAALLPALLAAACSSSTRPHGNGPVTSTTAGRSGATVRFPANAELAVADVPRASTKSGASDVPTLVAGNNAFAFDLYEKLAAGDRDNLVFSPASISNVISMLAGGAARRDAASDRRHVAFRAAGRAPARRLQRPRSDARSTAPCRGGGEGHTAPARADRRRVGPARLPSSCRRVPRPAGTRLRRGHSPRRLRAGRRGRACEDQRVRGERDARPHHRAVSGGHHRLADAAWCS